MEIFISYCWERERERERDCTLNYTETSINYGGKMHLPLPTKDTLMQKHACIYMMVNQLWWICTYHKPYLWTRILWHSFFLMKGCTVQKTLCWTSSTQIFKTPEPVTDGSGEDFSLIQWESFKALSNGIYRSVHITCLPFWFLIRGSK
jgi:hypothetical protein